mgnify:CR=1 FL=1
MSSKKVLTLQQILKAENNFIVKKSHKELINFAGKKVGKFLYKNFRQKKILFICGVGNNGMDGIIAAQYLKNKKIDCDVFKVSKNSMQNEQIIVRLFDRYQVLVDCIFGTGLNKEVNGNLKKVIEKINYSKKYIIAIDLPSGIKCDTGQILGISVKANLTLCMGFYKPAHFLLPGKINSGEKKIIKLSLKVPEKLKPNVNLINSEICNLLPKFKPDCNKYDRGHVLVLGGEMSGASRIVALVSRKIGCGLSTIGVSKNYLKYYNGVEVGTIVQEITEDLLKKKDVLVIGPGLGKNFNKKEIIFFLNAFKGPIVIDADAISVFKDQKKLFYQIIRKKKNIVLTPHKGEFNRLFTESEESKLQNCIKASKLINNSIVYKGNDTVVCFEDESLWISHNATERLATAGTGDILCGLISGLIAQKMNYRKAILAGVYILGELSQIKKNLTAEDFIGSVTKILLKLKKK